VSFKLWPAIDIRAGKCVRLVQGRFSEETVYGDPLEQAEAFVAAGAERLHVVDLDAARDGGSPNGALIRRIAAMTGVAVQAGGGVRDQAGAATLLEGGVARVVVGTVAVEQPELVFEMTRQWAGRVVVGLDHRRGVGPNGEARREVAVRGWVTGSGLGLKEALGRLEGLDLAGVVVTDIDRDGTGSGPDLEGLESLLGTTSLGLVASGGVASADHLAALARLSVRGRQLDGAIVGRALLSGEVSFAEAVAACEL
jgi:phosphoribosylformimino-5-aminoimidazole carboxamide ribotide isomerase